MQIETPITFFGSNQPECFHWISIRLTSVGQLMNGFLQIRFTGKQRDFPSKKRDSFVICTFPAERGIPEKRNFVQPAQVPRGRDFILSRPQVLAHVLRPNHHSVLLAPISLEVLLEVASSSLSSSFRQKIRKVKTLPVSEIGGFITCFLSEDYENIDFRRPCAMRAPCMYQ